MDIWSDEDLDRLEQRVDYALHTEDDGRALIIAPQAIKDLIAELRRLRGRSPEQPYGPISAVDAGSGSSS